MPTAYLPEQLLILLMPLKAYPAKIDILSRNAWDNRIEKTPAFSIRVNPIVINLNPYFASLHTLKQHSPLRLRNIPFLQ